MSSPLKNNLIYYPDILDLEHVRYFDQALYNLLPTPCAEAAFSQLLDGLPTEDSMRRSFWYLKSHPVYQLNHSEMSEESRAKFKDLRSNFDKSRLHLDPLLSNSARRRAYHRLIL